MARSPSSASTNVGTISTKRDMQDTIVEAMAERVRDLAERQALNASRLGAAIGVPSSSAANYWSGKRPWPTEVLHLLAARLQTTIDYLLGRTEDSGVVEFRGSSTQFDEMVDMVSNLRDRKRARQEQDSSPSEDRVEIASVDLAYGMGGTFLDVGDADVEKVPFSRSWLRANIADAPPEVLGVAQGIGDSMEPVLSDRDLVFFDRSARLEEHVSDKMWVFAYGQVGMIKRLRPMPDGTVKIMSANRTYPDEAASDGELHIIGRVVASLRRH